jgi:hypothetical protein
MNRDIRKSRSAKNETGAELLFGIFRAVLTVVVTLAYFILFPAGAVFQSSAQSVVPKGSRALSIIVTAPQNSDYETSFELARNIGIQQIGLALDWKDIETQAGVYDNPYLKSANIGYPLKNMAVDLTIRPIATNRKVTPQDLLAIPFNDEQMISRFEHLLDYIFSQTRNIQFSSIVIGSEIDIYLNAVPPPPVNLRLNDSSLRQNNEYISPWMQYTYFCKSIAQYIRARKPGIKIAFEATHKGLVGSSKTDLQALNQYSDLIGVSYYPINDDYSVQDPSTPVNDFQTIVSLYPGRTLFFYQLGYPSSTLLKSSEQKQAQFIEAVFRGWDACASQIGMIDFTFLTDPSPKDVEDGARYFHQTQNQLFYEFIRTLGLRRYPDLGEDKPSFLTLQQETQARGW